MRCSIVMVGLLSLAGTAYAETTSYGYDVFGRLVGSGRSGGPGDGQRNETKLDPVDNRTNFSTRDVRITLLQNQPMYSADGRFRLMLQGDGNLVLYMNSSLLWQTATNGSGANRAILQSDGNFVLWGADNLVKWQSNSPGNNGAFLLLQNDGNLAIYDVADRLVWYTNTGGH